MKFIYNLYELNMYINSVKQRGVSHILYRHLAATDRLFI